MSIILSLETSTHVCSVALHADGALLASAVTYREQSHASKLAVLIDQVLQLADVTMAQLSAVAVSSGPGSYTGLRIGTSTAKGLCYALNIPLIGVGALDSLALAAGPFNTSRALLCPMIDARRMEVYCQLLDAEYGVVSPVEAKVIDSESFREPLDAGPILFFGNGAAKCQEMIQHKNAFFLVDVHPGADTVGKLAWEKFRQHETEDLVTFEPFYLKEFMIKTPVKQEVAATVNKTV
jgi:tRNA threonylcarbamoyladenosine biosynthesis protein TsaB